MASSSSASSPLLQLARTRSQARILSSGLPSPSSSNSSSSPSAPTTSPYFSPSSSPSSTRNRRASSSPSSTSVTVNPRRKASHLSLEYETATPPSPKATATKRRRMKQEEVSSEKEEGKEDVGPIENGSVKNLKSEVKEEKEMKMLSGVKKGPKNWEEHLRLIQEMRKNKGAPVDDMGCESCPDAAQEGPVYRYQVLLSALLSAQTRDQITNAAMKRLIAHGCTINNILKTSEKKIGELIYPVGFWQRKASYILQVSKILKEKHNSDVPNSLKDLVALPGIGPKMAHLTLSVAWNNTVGICVDTHVHRISARLGWTKLKPNALPEDTRKSLEEWLPRSWWRDINPLLVGFGQTICQPVAPRCSQCLCNQICPTSSVKKI